MVCVMPHDLLLIVSKLVQLTLQCNAMETATKWMSYEVLILDLPSTSCVTFFKLPSLRLNFVTSKSKKVEVLPALKCIYLRKKMYSFLCIHTHLLFLQLYFIVYAIAAVPVSPPLPPSTRSHTFPQAIPTPLSMSMGHALLTAHLLCVLVLLGGCRNWE